MDTSNVKVIDVNGDVTVLGVGLGTKVAMVISSTSMPGLYTYRRLSLPTDRKKRVSLVEKNTLTSSRFPVYVCPLSATALREKRGCSGSVYALYFEAAEIHNQN